MSVGSRRCILCFQSSFWFQVIFGPEGANYTEQLLWRDAATGKLLAASDYFFPMPQGMQVWPGYGGLNYYGQIDSHIISLQTLPKTG